MDFSQIVKDTFVPTIIGKVLFLACCSALIVLLPNINILSILAIIGVVYLIWYLKAKINVNYFLLANYIFVIAIILISLFVSQKIVKDVPGLIAFITIMVVIDVISFTNLRLSKYTLNTAVINNKKLLSKLLIYADVKKYPFYLPIFGMGDVYFLSVILSSLYALNKSFLLYGNILILFGTVLDIALIWIFHNKEKFKGYPATVGATFFIYLFFIVKSLNIV